MSNNDKTLNERISAVYERFGQPEPPEYLAYIGCGVDPSAPNRLRDMVLEAQAAEIEGLPLLEDWQRIKELILSDPRYEGEPLYREERTEANMEILKYQYPKLKAVDVSGQLQHQISVKPLTKEEIEKFEESFFNDF